MALGRARNLDERCQCWWFPLVDYVDGLVVDHLCRGPHEASGKALSRMPSRGLAYPSFIFVITVLRTTTNRARRSRWRIESHAADCIAPFVHPGLRKPASALDHQGQAGVGGEAGS